MKTTPTQTPSSCKADSLLTKEQMTDRIITAKVNKQLTWTAIAEQLGANWRPYVAMRYWMPRADAPGSRRNVLHNLDF